ncbi:MAG: GspH/FimT family pseudopilin [Thermodesulfobacteriota bacterium]
MWSAGRIKAAGAERLRSRYPGGFTLLELIVVLAIISLMSALIVPRLSGPLGNLELKTTARTISASLRYARSRAAAEKTVYAALFDLDKNRLVIVDPPLTMGDFRVNHRVTMERKLLASLDRQKDFRTYLPPDGVRLAEGTFRGDRFQTGLFPVYFFPGGGSSGGEITVVNTQGRRYRVSVDMITGSVRLFRVTA